MLKALFHRCYYSYLRGDLEEAKMFFEFLRDEYRKSGDKNALSPYQLRLLRTVRDALRGKEVRSVTWEEDLPAEALKPPENDQSHRDVVREIHRSIKQLQNALGRSVGELRLHNIEHPCPPGRMDMLYLDDVFAYPVEVKPEAGKHDIVGQILKYDLSCRMNIHLGFWQDVQPVTVCGGYSKWALRELKKHGVITILHTNSKNGLNLKKV